MHRNVNNNKAAKIIFRSLSDVRDNKTIIIFRAKIFGVTNIISIQILMLIL